MQIGVDEAGKGPVLGPMVAAAVRAPLSALPETVDDSKRLSTSCREQLAAELQAHPDIGYGIAVVPVERIDDPSTDMNELTVVAQAQALDAVATPEDTVLADAGDTDADRFARRLRDAAATASTQALPVEARHGADAEDPLVAAASILAKVERDSRLHRLGDAYERQVGSGYPSDPTTREFLRQFVRDHGKLPSIARRSWATSRDVLAAAEQSALDEF